MKALLRGLVVSVILIVLAYGLFELGISRQDIKHPAEDLHGFSGCLLPLIFAIIMIFVPNIVQGNRQVHLIHLPTTIPADEHLTLAPNFTFDLSKSKTLTLLSVIWIIGVFYCELLYISIHSGFTDKNVIGVELDPITVAIIQNEVRGSLFYGSFLPLIAVSSFLGALVCKQRLSLISLSLPAICSYGIINLLGIAVSGEASSMQGVKHLMLRYSDGKSIPTDLGTTAIIWLLSFGAFLVWCAVFAILAWLFYLLGRFAKRKLSPSV